MADEEDFMSVRVFGLLMAGGKGTRLWPKSTEKFPKQFLPLINSQSFLKNSLDRLLGIIPKENLYVVSTDDQKHLVERDYGQVITEPVGRNTAPCIYLSLLELEANGCGESDVVCIFPADHYIDPVGAFHQTIQEGVAMAKGKEELVIVGITPEYPHTGYGYIEKGRGERVASFKEKPCKQLAQEYMDSGKYLWNAGIFLGTWGAFYRHFKDFCPDYIKVSDPRSHYEQFKAVSFDDAILERSPKLLFVEGAFHWSDVGEWKALEKIGHSSQENLSLGQTKMTSIDSQGNIIWDDEGHVALIGVSNLVVIRHEGKLLVMNKDRSGDIKKLHEIWKLDDSLKHLF